MIGRRALLGQVLAEFLGTLVLITLGDGVVAMVKLFGTGASGEETLGPSGHTGIERRLAVRTTGVHEYQWR